MDIANILEMQRAYFNSGETGSVSLRKSRLKKLKEVILSRENEIYEALSMDLGKGTMEAFSSEVAFCLNEIDHTLWNLERWAKPRRVNVPPLYLPASAKIYPEPLGVVLIVSPWNYPFQLVISPLVGAIAAGNCAFIKPSSLSENTAILLEEIIGEVFPPEHVSLLRISSKDMSSILEHKFDLIFYTGSTRVGRIVMRSAARHLTPVILELGGKSPCIVDASADLEISARRIVWGKFMNAGQTCVAPDYVLVHESIKAEFIKMMKKQLDDFYGKEPRLSVDYSRIISEKHFRRLVSLIKGDIVAGGEYIKEELYIAPTIIDNVTWDSKIMEEEIFGPILPVLGFETLDEIIKQINYRPKPLALYVFSGYEYVKEKILRHTSSGGVCVNHTLIHLAPGGLPFGGVGDSGMGSYHGKASFDSFSHFKSVLRKPFSFDNRFLYPPYGRISALWRSILRLFI